jgi:hypothetical protein
MKTWIERIRQHALIHYTEDGWDILTECWTDEYIAEHYRGCKNYEEAVVAISDVLAAIDGYRREIQAEVF